MKAKKLLLGIVCTVVLTVPTTIHASTTDFMPSEDAVLFKEYEPIPLITYDDVVRVSSSVKRRLQKDKAYHTLYVVVVTYCALTPFFVGSGKIDAINIPDIKGSLLKKVGMFVLHIPRAVMQYICTKKFFYYLCCAPIEIGMTRFLKNIIDDVAYEHTILEFCIRYAPFKPDLEYLIGYMNTLFNATSKDIFYSQRQEEILLDFIVPIMSDIKCFLGFAEHKGKGRIRYREVQLCIHNVITHTNNWITLVNEQLLSDAGGQFRLLELKTRAYLDALNEQFQHIAYLLS